MSLGVNVVERVCVPTGSTVPAAGLYANDPGTDDIASSWNPLNWVPYVIGLGVVQEIIGLAGKAPDPLKAIVWGEPGALSFIVTLAAAAPL